MGIAACFPRQILRANMFGQALDFSGVALTSAISEAGMSSCLASIGKHYLSDARAATQRHSLLLMRRCLCTSVAEYISACNVHSICKTVSLYCK